MKLVFYGGGELGDSPTLDRITFKLTGRKKPSVTYIPSSHYWAEDDFRVFVKYYNKQGIERFVFFPVDIPFDKTLLSLALRSDVIHLSGGNTYSFLHNLRKSGMMVPLKEFVRKGGVLTGLSAGAILMTPTIDSAKYPSFDQDDNEENIKNLKALNLVNFDFCPHYKNSPRYDRELTIRSKKIAHPLYACPDGGGIVAEKEKITFVGRCYVFFRGIKTPLFC